MKKTMLLVCLIAAVLASGSLASADVIYSMPTDFSGTQGQGGWHYGAVSHPNYTTTWVANWTDYPNYDATSKFWWRIAESGIWKRVYGDQLWSNHTDGPGVYWQADQAYAQLAVSGQVTSGGWGAYLNYWDASASTNTALTQGVANTLYNVAAGDKIAFIMNAGPGSTQIDYYNLAITVVPEPAALSLLLLGGLVLARRRR